MPPEAWVALIVGTVTLFFTIVGATWYLSWQSAKTSTTVTSLDGRMESMESSIDKMEETLKTVATQKEQIQSIRDTMAANTARTDETFKRVFASLEKLQERLPARSYPTSGPGIP